MANPVPLHPHPLPKHYDDLNRNLKIIALNSERFFMLTVGVASVSVLLARTFKIANLFRDTIVLSDRFHITALTSFIYMKWMFREMKTTMLISKASREIGEGKALFKQCPDSDLLERTWKKIKEADTSLSRNLLSSKLSTSTSIFITYLASLASTHFEPDGGLVNARSQILTAGALGLVSQTVTLCISESSIFQFSTMRILLESVQVISGIAVGLIVSSNI